MLGSLKNSFSVEIPNFPHRKLKMIRIEYRFDRKMHPSMEIQPSILFSINCGERSKNQEALASIAAQSLEEFWGLKWAS